MKTIMIAKIALQEDIAFNIKRNLAKYINKEFKGSLVNIQKSSKLVNRLTEIKEYNNKET